MSSRTKTDKIVVPQNCVLQLFMSEGKEEYTIDVKLPQGIYNKSRKLNFRRIDNNKNIIPRK